jgi:thiamine-monophosphate kinase
MGARPTALVVALSAPADLEAAWVESLADGLQEEADRVGASIVGGDVSAADAVAVAVTALGDLEGRDPVTRAGARSGDLVVVFGRLGWAAAGLAMLEAGRVGHPIADAHRRPVVAYDETLAAARSGLLTSLIDVSDGLVADLGHIVSASGVRIELTAAALPLASEVADAAAALGVDPLDWVSTGGDDHAFVGTLRGDVPAGAAVIGRVGADEPGVVFTDRATPRRGGHEHFS